ncbi:MULTISPECIES: hypothetical protein [unclassified Streptomyces]|nr:hypothetical protein [Streptomyces sp. YPW6]
MQITLAVDDLIIEDLDDIDGFTGDPTGWCAVTIPTPAAAQ